jgi:hypothetical protein
VTWHRTDSDEARAQKLICGGARSASVQVEQRRCSSQIHGRLAPEAAGIAAEEAAPDATTPGGVGEFGLPVGASGPAVEAGALATTAADGSDASDAPALGTCGTDALAGTTITVAAGASVGLLQAARAVTTASVPQIANRFIGLLRGADRTEARSPA